ncbi:MAG: carboxypeptidase regulatory-like domain-containing protein, partial [bacterium]|nr:carboxypeptidase regulatory-like domain-containing protein [bacterium]
MSIRKETISKIIITAIFIFTACINLSAGNGVKMSVSGFVKNADTGSPIPKIAVTVFKIEYDEIVDSFRQESDYNGYYKIRLLDAGNYRVGVSIPQIGLVH